MFQFDPAAVVPQSTPIQAGHHSAPGTAVIVATRGRPGIVASLVKRLGEQTRPPAHIFIIASKEADVAQLDRTQKNLTIRIGGREGSTYQRNNGLDLAGSQFGFIVFFDDDFVPSRFWLERMEAIFAARPDVAGITGDVLADGTRTAGIPLDEARATVDALDAAPRPQHGRVQDHFAYGSNVGCNMAYRYTAIRDLRFDEKLPLYAWHEDSDFRGQVERRALFARADELWGVHLGHKSGRGSGVTLGYSQVANAVYLARKGTVPSLFLAQIAARNVIINALRSFRPEPFVDRRGRLKGNMIALIDLLRGRLAPDRILQLR